MPTLAEIDRCAKRPVDVWTLSLYYPLSQRLVWVVARWPRITPNTLTLASLAICLAGCAGLAAGRPDRFFAGLALVQASYVMDCADGQLARLRRQFSPIGGWLDQVADRMKEFAIYLGLADGWMRQHPQSDAWAFAMAALFSLYLLEYLGQIAMFRQPGSKDPLPAPGSLTPAPAMQRHGASATKPGRIDWQRLVRWRRFVPFCAYNIGEQYFALLVFGAFGAVHAFLCFSATLGLAMCVYRPLVAAVKFHRAAAAAPTTNASCAPSTEDTAAAARADEGDGPI
ncbi:CDP-alcohol phosphatidyltransferase family protein [Alicyclobacillus kakegawensis]|uniref:CDP-alcohol phosphatidyltransferase family protein n=1 Tax=Alicyclobacillus kakegawensis TaxID=392012 RepID=UPI000B2A1F4B|nr:CDP-alcohol phosphatidyltransferase family protein [Alicyclobacillus kakegawensis]